MEPGSEAPEIAVFGRFRLFPRRRELLADGAPVKLGGRAFEILMALIGARGAIVSKDELRAAVWPDRIVEENNLQWQISSLRAALGPDRDLIRTSSGRGYQFAGEVRLVPERMADRAEPGLPPRTGEAVRPSTNLPMPVSDLIGRDVELKELLGLLAEHRLVTLTGLGGIGKTQLALAAARQKLSQYPDGVWLAELAALTDPDLVPVAVAGATGLDLGTGPMSAQRVANALDTKSILLVLDNCEHVVNAAAALAEGLLHANSRVRILATSREPLKAEGEQVYPVPPLAVPAAGAADLDAVLRSGAVRLFIERARAAEPHFAVERDIALTIAAVCRRLDGIPLAIELAAARTGALGIKQIAARLDNGFDLLAAGRRTALKRHQTLRATLDWSYGLLSVPERVILRRLAVFTGTFSLEAAEAVVTSPELAAPAVVDELFSLVTKSLVRREGEGTVTRYRLLETTRDYAREKLDKAGERQLLACRHAEYYRKLFERAETEWEVRPTAEWLSEYQAKTDNLRAALDWAFSPDGDASIGVALTAAAVPLWMQLSLIEECVRRVRRALASVTPGADRDARPEMKLHAALGAALIATNRDVPQIAASCTRALELAESLDDAEYRLRSLWGLWLFNIIGGQHPAALTLAEKFLTVASAHPDPNYRRVGERMMGAARHHLGDQPGARRHLERALAHPVAPDKTLHFIDFTIDHRVMSHVYLARVLWLQGYPDQAMRAAEASLEEAQIADHTISVCYALAVAACPVASLTGDLNAMERYVRMLLVWSARSTDVTLKRFLSWAHSYQGALAIGRGDSVGGFRLLRASFDEYREGRFSIFQLITFQMAEALGRAGQIAEGLAVIEEAVEPSQSNREGWLSPELLRVKGELFLMQAPRGAEGVAETHFGQALEMAHRQGALSWELRAAVSLARLWRDQGRSAEALALLEQVYNRFTEGFETADPKFAKTLLDALRQV